MTNAALRVDHIPAADPEKLHIGFIMPTEVGWETLYLNWRNTLGERDLGVDPQWIPIRWWKEGGLIERIPGLPGGIKARLRSRIEVHEGLAHGPFDALFVGGGHMLHRGRAKLSRQPYFLTTDATPRQLHTFGDHYGIYPSRFAAYERHKFRGWQERYQGALALFPWSTWAGQSLVEDYGADASRIHVMPPGVDVARWKCPVRDGRDGPVNILFVGGHFRRKGGHLLLDWAWRTAARDWTLHVVTRDRFIPEHPNVRVYNGLSPNDPELLSLYRQADIFALPTRADCYSIASIEAMAAGLPVILGKTGGTGDVVTHGETGFLIETSESVICSDLHDHLDTLIHDPDLRLAMGKAARRIAEVRYDARSNVARTLEIMRRAMAG